MFSSQSRSLIWRGILGLVIGIVAIAWPAVTILALVILFAVYAFFDAGLQLTRSFSSATTGPALGHLLLAVVGFAAGLVALTWPGITAVALTIVVAIWAFLGGFMALWAAAMHGETAGTRAMFIVDGLVMVAFGVVLCARPDAGTVTLALLFGFFSVVLGAGQIVTGVQIRRRGNAFDRLSLSSV